MVPVCISFDFGFLSVSKFSYIYIYINIYTHIYFPVFLSDSWKMNSVCPGMAGTWKWVNSLLARTSCISASINRRVPSTTRSCRWGKTRFSFVVFHAEHLTSLRSRARERQTEGWEKCSTFTSLQRLEGFAEKLQSVFTQCCILVRLKLLTGRQCPTWATQLSTLSTISATCQ